MSTTPKKSYNFGRTLKAIQAHYSCDVLDEFHSLLHSAVAQSTQSFRKNYESLRLENFEDESQLETYRSYLEDDFHQLGEAKKLGDALAISGLYRQVETHVARVLASTFPDMGKGKRADILRGIRQPEIDSSMLAGFDAVNELRLLNNVIKHAGSRVDHKLADAFPVWIQGEELQDLDKTYERLKPLVKRYMQAFVAVAYDRSTAFEPAPTP